MRERKFLLLATDLLDGQYVEPQDGKKTFISLVEIDFITLNKTSTHIKKQITNSKNKALSANPISILFPKDSKHFENE